MSKSSEVLVPSMTTALPEDWSYNLEAEGATPSPCQPAAAQLWPGGQHRWARADWGLGSDSCEWTQLPDPRTGTDLGQLPWAFSVLGASTNKAEGFYCGIALENSTDQLRCPPPWRLTLYVIVYGKGLEGSGEKKICLISFNPMIPKWSTLRGPLSLIHIPEFSSTPGAAFLGRIFGPQMQRTKWISLLSLKPRIAPGSWQTMLLFTLLFIQSSL